VARFLASSEGKELLMGDILRVLLVCMGALWLPELKAELEGFRRTLGEEPPSEPEIEEALRELESTGLVRVKPGIRATHRPEGERTYLIQLTRDESILRIIAADDRLARYTKIWEDVLAELREK
jgi:hypothetical protein